MRVSYERNLLDGLDPSERNRATELSRLIDIGVIYEPFMTDEECQNLLAVISRRRWMNDLKRRVQHYAWKYDYTSRTLSEDMRIGALPDFLRDVAMRLHERGWFDLAPDQVIVNEYRPGQGIAPHVDRDCFGPTVATLSLGDAWPMEFAPANRDRARTAQANRAREKIELVLDVGSILVLRGASRSSWTHGIAPRHADGRGRSRRPRRTRVSVTFRTVKRDRF